MLLKWRHLWSHIRYRSIPLRSAAEPRTREFSAGPVDTGIRWLGDVDIGGRIHHALFAHPDSLVDYRLPTHVADLVIARCTLLPEVWNKQRGRVDFELAVSDGEGGTTRAALGDLRYGGEPRSARRPPR